MKKNVGKVDQIVRYGLAVVFLVLAIVLENYWLLIGTALMGFTAAFGMCGIYRIFGINTCKLNK
jgi:hypothetical protein